jgi:ankyrin repeat protein
MASKLIKRTWSKLKRNKASPDDDDTATEEVPTTPSDIITKSAQLKERRLSRRLSIKGVVNVVTQSDKIRNQKRSVYEITPEWISDLSNKKAKRDGLFATFPIVSKSPATPLSAKFCAKFEPSDNGNYRAVTTEATDDTSEYSPVEVVFSPEEQPYIYSLSVPTNSVLEDVSDKKNIQETLFNLCKLPLDGGCTALSELLPTIDVLHIDQIRNTTTNCTLFHCAARHNNVQCMKILYDTGANINAIDSIEATPLHYACASGSNDAVVFLLSHQANVNAKDQYQAFPLLVAMRNNYPNIMKLLIMNNADVHLKCKGDTCLHIAAKNGFLSRAKLLVSEGASITRLNSNNEHVLYASLSNRSITQYICDTLSFSVLCKLVSVTNCFGKTVIHEACEFGYLESLLVILQSITQKSLVEDFDMNSLDEFMEQRLNEFDVNKGYTPLHLAVINGHTKIVKFLAMCSQVDINRKDMAHGNTALHFAIGKKYSEICEVLLSFGKASPEVRNESKESARRLSRRIGTEIPSIDDKSMVSRRMSLQVVRRGSSLAFHSQYQM